MIHEMENEMILEVKPGDGGTDAELFSNDLEEAIVTYMNGNSYCL